MKSFFIKLIIFLLLVGVPYYYVQKQNMMREDAFYWKSTQQADHLVIGCSRACHGIHPSVLKQELGITETMVNFAFNVNASPYGRPYYEAIQRKLTAAPSGKGIYILSVAPANIMDLTTGKGARESTFRFYKLWNMNLSPNVEYVFRQPRPDDALLVKILDRKYIHPVQEKYALTDGAQYNLGKKTVRNNWGNYPSEKFYQKSTYREDYLHRTIALLAARGNVFLVRLPVSQQKIVEESQIYPDFDQMMEDIAASYDHVSYYNYNDTLHTEYSYYDNIHHLEGKSAQLFSKNLARRIGSELKVNEF